MACAKPLNNTPVNVESSNAIASIAASANFRSSLSVITIGAFSTILLSLLDEKNAEYARYLVAAMFFFLCFIWSTEKITGLILFLLPNQRLLVFTDGGVSFLNVLLITTLLSVLVLKTKRFKAMLSARSYVLLSVTLFVYSLQYLLRYGSFLDSALAIKFILMTMFSVLFLEQTKNRYHLFKYMAYLYVFGSILGLLSGVLGNDSFELVTRFRTNELTSPGNTAEHASFGIAILLVLSSIRRPNLFTTVLLIALLIIGFLTQSRSFLLAVLVSGMAYVGFGRLRKMSLKAALNTLGYALFVVCILVLLLQFTPLGKVYDTALERVITPARGDITNERGLLWALYFNQWISSLPSFFLGIGSNEIMNRLDVEQVPHNFLLEAAVYYGLTGLFIICGVYWAIWRRFRLQGAIGPRLFFYLPLLIAIQTSLTESSLMGMTFFFQFILSLMAINYCVANHNMVRSLR